MQYSDLEALGARVSLLGFGAMRLPQKSEDPADVDIDMLRDMVDIAVTGGVNYFDTAYAYHKGFSEPALRQALVERHDRDSYYLADKLAVFLCDRPEDQERMFETQRERCGVDHFDFYLIHAITDARYEQCLSFGSFAFLRKLRETGAARRIGFSFHGSPQLLARVLDEQPGFEFVQLQINYQDWNALHAAAYHRVAAERGLPILVMEPVKGGSLANLPPTAAALSAKLSTPAEQAAFALRFAASRANVAAVLSGMTTPEQVRGNVRLFGTPEMRRFSAEEIELVDRILDETRKIANVPCTACRYCLGACPVGIDIPRIFSVYNEFKRSGVAFHAQYMYSCIEDGRRADACIACGACAALCPQGIDIPRELAALHPQLPLMRLVPENDGS